MGIDQIIKESVRGLMKEFLGIRANEIAGKLNIGVSTAERHFREIRAEWQAKQ